MDGLLSADDKIKQLEEIIATAMTPREKIDALNALAWQLRDIDRPRCLEYSQTAHDLATAEQYSRGIADSLINLCQTVFSDYSRALAMAFQALEIYDRLNDPVGQSRAYYTFCFAHWFADNFDQSVEFGTRALQLAQATGERSLQADILNNLGLAYKRSGNYELAHTVYQQALAIFRELSDEKRQGKVLTNIALAFAEEGKYDRALEFARAGLQMPNQSARVGGYILFVMGQIYAGKKDFASALNLLEQAVQFANANAEHEQLAIVAFETMGQVYAEQNNFVQAIAHYQNALTLADKIKSNLYAFRCHESLAKIYEHQADSAQALYHYKQFHILKETLFNDKNAKRLQWLETQHKTEIMRQQAEIYHLRNIELEKEITERKRLEQELEQQALTDVLTQIANRRHFLISAQQEIARAQRHRNALALALLDLDHFKQINDRSGHAVGDRALIELTKIVSQNIRVIDIFARFGGDEFALLLPETDGATAYRVIERVRKTLTLQPLYINGIVIALTISIGIASLTHESDSVDTLLARADQALYRAKENGRNQIQIAVNETLIQDISNR